MGRPAEGKAQAQEVCCYEAGLTRLDHRHAGVNSDRTDALELSTRLGRYLAGNDTAPAIVHVPTKAEKMKRARKCQRQQLREQRTRTSNPMFQCKAMGRQWVTPLLRRGYQGEYIRHHPHSRLGYLSPEVYAQTICA